MNPDNTNTIFIYGSKEAAMNCLFEVAMFWAEQAMGVWFISPQPFNNMPKIWKKAPDKEVLKYITFMYIPTTSNLLEKLHEIHEWYKIPRIILVSCIDQFCFSSENKQTSALLCASLLNAIGICAQKYIKKDAKTTAATFTAGSAQSTSSSKDNSVPDKKITNTKIISHLILTCSDNLTENKRTTMQTLINAYFFNNLFEINDENYKNIVGKIIEIFNV